MDHPNPICFLRLSPNRWIPSISSLSHLRLSLSTSQAALSWPLCLCQSLDYPRQSYLFSPFFFFLFFSWSLNSCLIRSPHIHLTAYHFTFHFFFSSLWSSSAFSMTLHLHHPSGFQRSMIQSWLSIIRWNISSTVPLTTPSITFTSLVTTVNTSPGLIESGRPIDILSRATMPSSLPSVNANLAFVPLHPPRCLLSNQAHHLHPLRLSSWVRPAVCLDGQVAVDRWALTNLKSVGQAHHWKPTDGLNRPLLILYLSSDLGLESHGIPEATGEQQQEE